uniref:RNA helicase n=1 Tax=Chelydra serpentina TaxID=8475 RepID=A0A8C3SBX7_CHESE
MAENPTAGVVPEEEEDNLEYDSDGNPIAPSKKVIDPLPPIDHSEIEYPPFEKNFYEEHEEISSLTPQQIVELRHKLNLRVSGAAPPRPGSSFAHFGFDEQLMHQIRKSEYTQPTPIQCQGVPVALSGRDMIGIAKTGSGKTAAFIWPMLIHIMDQKELESGDGPIAVIVCPTRELCQQIHAECKRFGKAYNLRSVAVYGGGSMWEQAKALQEGAEIVVCTPGRLIDHVKKKATNLQRVSYLVFDEADRMFDMGFEYQVRSVASHVRPDRQTLLFSATFRKKIEKLARDILIDPIRVVQGDIGELTSGFSYNRVGLTGLSSSSLLFELCKVAQVHLDGIYLCKFKIIKLIVMLLCVTARGLDIPSIKTVVNYDVARDIDTHTHRIGRTGRAGEKGIAYTLLTPKDSNFAGDLVRNMEGANQHVSKELLDLAMQNAWFRKSRFKGGKGKKLNIGGGGLGYRERPGLGSDGSDRGSSSNVMSNYEAYKPSTGAMGDRLSAMKAAFQSQYKSHFVAASLNIQKPGSSAAGASGWTSAGSLNSVPTNSAQQNAASPDSPIAAAVVKGIPGFTSAGNLSSVPGYPGVGIQGFNSTSASINSREGGNGSGGVGGGGSGGVGGGGGGGGSGRERYSDNRSNRHNDSPARHGDGSGRHSDSQRHGDGGGRHSDGYRQGDNRHGESHRHSESRHSNGRNNENRINENKKDGSNRDSKTDGFAVPEPPKRKKSRWDS